MSGKWLCRIPKITKARAIEDGSAFVVLSVYNPGVGRSEYTRLWSPQEASRLVEHLWDIDDKEPA